MMWDTDPEGAGGYGTLRHSVVEGNWATNMGGGVSVFSGRVENCVIAGNACSGKNGAGGGIENWHSTMMNCTITRNSATWIGGVYLRGGYATNTIMHSNPPLDYYSSGSPVCSFCCTQPAIPGGVGNIDGDPQFVNALSNDFHLTASSPCIDAGTNTDDTAGGTDIDGQPRVYNGRVDIGADEAFVIGARIQAAGPVTTVWDSVVGGEYVLQRTTDLNTTNWTQVGQAGTTQQAQVTFVDTNVAAADRAFYRLLWLRP